MSEQASAARIRAEMNAFFISVQRKAFKQAEFAVKNPDDALDIVQDAMEKLAKKYSDKPDDWGPLFQRILQNAIKDWYRRQKVRNVMSWFAKDSDGEDTLRALEQGDGHSLEENGPVSFQGPERAIENQKTQDSVIEAIRHLPFRQQQAFILRAWWENDLNETASIMGCSVGSVKTHYFRALSRLREGLEEQKHEQNRL